MSGPEERFTALYQLHYEDIARYLRRRAPELDCRDLVADVFLVAWRRFAELERARLPLPWLYGVARRVLANACRGARRADGLVAKAARYSGRDLAADHTEQTEDRLALAAALAGLGETDREALRLIAWEGLSTRDAAAALGCSAAALSMRLLRLRRRLRTDAWPALALLTGGA
ncbi:sigma-70 family RNA polymerase sigma factor [Crossiella sp. CA-258035]|uniref:RNA polymerase sigma factor n=1 Tax=Crossiella sp. CA-258035 TaxID=2981138 RepID=UPI0024BCEE13|nr:sigma-70 family RNA polymerase sigma factor [Crossiella sp. CA-258035]WHT18899.1 sigma-70 family RNA polymerase sigma factor [Crossiella sp. CA-258035]